MCLSYHANVKNVIASQSNECIEIFIAFSYLTWPLAIWVFFFFSLLSLAFSFFMFTIVSLHFIVFVFGRFTLGVVSVAVFFRFLVLFFILFLLPRFHMISHRNCVAAKITIYGFCFLFFVVFLVFRKLTYKH